MEPTPILKVWLRSMAVAQPLSNKRSCGGTATTLAGSLTAMWLADGMLKKFSGRGLVPEELVQSPSFVTAAATGAALTSFLATRLGFPVSTTHALAGSLLGAGLAGSGTQVRFEALLTLFVLPLVFSPLVALCSSSVAYSLLKMTGKLPEGRTRTLDVLHFLSAGAASFARGLNDTPKMVALLLGRAQYGSWRCFRSGIADDRDWCVSRFAARGRDVG